MHKYALNSFKHSNNLHPTVVEVLHVVGRAGQLLLILHINPDVDVNVLPFM